MSTMSHGKPLPIAIYLWLCCSPSHSVLPRGTNHWSMIKSRNGGMLGRICLYRLNVCLLMTGDSSLGTNPRRKSGKRSGRAWPRGMAISTNFLLYFSRLKRDNNPICRDPEMNSTFEQITIVSSKTFEFYWKLLLIKISLFFSTLIRSSNYKVWVWLRASL